MAWCAVIFPAVVVVLLADTSHSAAPAARLPAKKIVSLSPSLTRMLNDIGAGGTVVGVTSFDHTFPDRPKVGTIVNPNIESIVMLRPDLVIASDEDGAVQCAEPLAGVRVPVIMLPRTNSFEAMLENYIALGDIVGMDAAAREKARAYAERKISREKTDARIVFLISNDPLIAASDGSFIGRIITDAGGICVVKGEGNPYPIISKEHFLALNPDIVVSVIDGGGDDMLARYAQFRSLRFVRNGAAYFIPSEIACYYTPADYLATRDELVRIVKHAEGR
jgi:iron complex transport system substrate-binding protein